METFHTNSGVKLRKIIYLIHLTLQALVHPVLPANVSRALHITTGLPKVSQRTNFAEISAALFFSCYLTDSVMHCMTHEKSRE